MALSVGVSAVTSNATSATTGSVTTTTGSGLELIVTGTGTTAPTVSDSNGNTWTQIGAREEIYTFPSSIWHYKNESGTRGAGHTFTAAGTDVSILVVEILGTNPVVDVEAAGTDGTSPFQSATVTPTVADFLLVASLGVNSGTNPSSFTAGGSFTLQQEATNGNLYWPGAVGTRIVTGGSGSYQSSWTNSDGATNSSGHQITAWKESGASPVITLQPVDNQSVADGGTISFDTTVTDATSYQWETLPPLGGSWGNVSGGSGATTADYTTGTLSRSSDSGRFYRLKATNSNGDTYSNVVTIKVTNIPTSYDYGGFVIGSG